jgi:hypothetical protein
MPLHEAPFWPRASLRALLVLGSVLSALPMATARPAPPNRPEEQYVPPEGVTKYLVPDDVGRLLGHSVYNAPPQGVAKRLVSNDAGRCLGRSVVAASASPATPAQQPRRGALPPPRIVNKRKVKIEFEVAHFGPSGLGAVDIYLTTNEGDSWEESSLPSEVTFPLSNEALATPPAQCSVTMELPREGIVYGVYLVAKSRAGRSLPPPSPGADPQVRIEVDTTVPVAELFRPQPDDSGRHDTVVLVWKAEDKNLAANPITLEWAANNNGPWETIGDSCLPNTGRYAWKITERVPAKVFLRLTVRDTAGNVAVAATSEPVLIDLQVPSRPTITRVVCPSSE